MGATLQTISINGRTVGELFEHHSMVIEPYQRDYTWTAGTEVKQLFDDLADHYSLDALDERPRGSGADEEYLLGGIVASRRQDASVELIDGQQRTLTVFVMLAALRTRLYELGEVDQAEILYDTLKMRGDDDQVRPRIKHHESDVNEFLFHIMRMDEYSREILTENRLTGSESRNRLVRAFRKLYREFADRLGPDPDLLRDYSRFIRNRVKFALTLTSSVEHALLLFERANDRGKPLEPSELLKNLLFQHEDRDHWNQLDARWKQLVKILGPIGGIQLMDAIRWHEASRPRGSSVSKRELYRHISARFRAAPELSTEGYLASLENAVSRLVRMVGDQTGPVGTRMPALAGLETFGGRRLRQHWPILLSAFSWEQDEFADMARALEGLMLAALVVDLRGQVLESWVEKILAGVTGGGEVEAGGLRIVVPSVGVRDAQTAEARKAITTCVTQLAAEIAIQSDFDRKVSQLHYDSDRNLVRYMLTLINSGIYNIRENKPLNGADGTDSRYSSDHIEHIWPKSNPGLYDPTDLDAVHRLGNLALWGNSPNPQAGAQPAQVKLATYYPNSDDKNVVLKNLGRVQPLPDDTAPAYVRAADRCPSGFVDWDPASAGDLASFYAETIKEIFGW